MTAKDNEILADLLLRARALAAEVDQFSRRLPETPLALRLACAHALGTVDQLEDVERTWDARSKAA